MDDLRVRRGEQTENEGLRVKETDGVGLGTKKVAYLVGGSVDEAVTNPFGHFDDEFDN